MNSYIIKKGRHGNFHIPKFYYNCKKLTIKAKFTESCRYDFGNVDNFDINKLVGVSFGTHHINSFRIGWNYDKFNANIIIYAYWYNNSVRNYKILYFCEINKEINIDIFINRHQNNIVICGCEKSHKINIIDFDFTHVSKWGYKLWPYFGGNNQSPHDLEVKLDFKVV